MQKRDIKFTEIHWLISGLKRKEGHALPNFH